MIDRGLTLACPGCGSHYMHQKTIQLFHRTMEDSDDGLYAFFAVDGCEFKMTKGEMPDGNPSWRRGGWTIGFACEECDLNPVLYIAQHKGKTHIQWAHDPDLHIQSVESEA